MAKSGHYNLAVTSAPQAVLTGMLASFVGYTGVVIWVFLARSAARAWAGLAVAAAPLLVAAGLVGAGVIAR
ncbi:MAG: hypothetical protein GAK40_01269 [Burkholderia plantarii]|nr:MAG: hypothetical protein GAK40_01269 [Burkholderia plantarii]